MRDAMNKLLYADDLTTLPDQGVEWHTGAKGDTGGVERVVYQTRPKRSLEKTDVLPLGHQMEELDIELKGKKLTQGDSFVYQGWKLWH